MHSINGNVSKRRKLFISSAGLPLAQHPTDTHNLAEFGPFTMDKSFDEYYKQRKNKQIDDLHSERKAVSFGVRDVTYLLDGGKEMTMVILLFVY